MLSRPSKTCLECGATIYKKMNCSKKNWVMRVKYCSLQCSRKHTLLDGSKQPTLEQRARGERNSKWKGGQLEKSCITCHKSYRVDQYRVNSRCCSFGCDVLYRKTDAGRLAFSESQRKSVAAEFYALTATFKKFKNLLRRCVRYNMWRVEVFERDNFTCNGCGMRGGKLCVDHIKPFISILVENKIETYEQALRCEELWNIGNGQTLCHGCHYKTPTFGSKVRRILINNTNIKTT